MANQFEKSFEEKFVGMRKRIQVYLHRLFPPMRVGGMRGSLPCWIQTGRALFDVAGWYPLKLTDINGVERKLAVYTGIEQKETGDRKASIRIVGDDGSGSGIQAHQLEALAALHRDGGIARLLWSNGGMVGVLDGEEIAAAHFNYGVSVQAEKMRKKVALGARSIPWSMFRPVDFDATPDKIILAPAKEPTLAQRLRANKRLAAKKIEEAENVFDILGDEGRAALDSGDDE